MKDITEPSVTSMDDRVRAVERITLLFRAERLIYMSFAIAAFLMLLASLAVALVRDGSSAGVLAAFGSSGIVAFTSSRVIVMWNKALSIVVTAKVSSSQGAE